VGVDLPLLAALLCGFAEKYASPLRPERSTVVSPLFVTLVTPTEEKCRIHFPAHRFEF